MSKVYRALGNLDPIYFFENASGHILLPPVEKGKGPELARAIFAKRYEPMGFMWKEAGTWSEVLKLQDRLVEQEQKRAREIRDQRMEAYDVAQSAVADNMRRRMTNSDCSAFERDACQYFLQIKRPEKRAEYEQRWKEAINYLWAAEMDSGTKPEDRMKGSLSL